MPAKKKVLRRATRGRSGASGLVSKRMVNQNLLVLGVAILITVLGYLYFKTLK